MASTDHDSRIPRHVVDSLNALDQAAGLFFVRVVCGVFLAAILVSIPLAVIRILFNPAELFLWMWWFLPLPELVSIVGRGKIWLQRVLIELAYKR